MPETDDAMMAAQIALGYVRLAETFKRTGEKPIEVSGAKGAYRVNYTYRTSDSHGGVTDRTIRGTDVAVVDGKGHAYVIRITRRKGQLDPGTLQRITASISMTGK